MDQKPRILIHVRDGTVTDVITDQECSVLIIDHDVDGILPEGQVTYEGLSAYVTSREVSDVQPERLRKAYNQFNR